MVIFEHLIKPKKHTNMAQYRKNPRSTRKRTNLTLDPDLWENIQDHCYSQGISVSELVNQLLRQNLAEATAAKKPKPKAPKIE